MLITQKDNIEETAKAAGEKISEICAANLGKKIYLLLSGGSAFKVLDYIDLKDTSSDVEISVIDERYDVEKENQNQYLLSETEFSKGLLENGGSLKDMEINSVSSLEDAENNMQKYFKDISESDGVVITLLGIGGDGHTVGMMPYPEDKDFFDKHFSSPDIFATSYDAKDKNDFPFRVTATGTFLKEIVDHAVVYATGENKIEALKNMLDKEDCIHEVPGRIIDQMKDVFIYTDQEIDN